MRVLLPTLIAILHLSAGAALAEVARPHAAPGLGEYDVPFYPGGTYREDVTPPGDFLGYPIGSKPASHPDILRYFNYLAKNFSNVSLHEYARTYEDRSLVYLVITSESNAANIDGIRADLRRLADPRIEGPGNTADLIEKSPAVAWLAYGIHGDELSSCDAALQIAYQLIAGTDEDTKKMRDELIVIIDPLQNPDGRTRWLAQLSAWNSVVTSHDVQSIQHTGSWPWGRTNHYLFDLNRDWFATVHPESQGKTAAALEWMPHYFLDCHEMGATDTYMFSPPREPFNPYMTDYIHPWWRRVADDHGAAFDQYGWSFYTREWNEEFFPGYGSSWSIYLGAIGMLFEQASTEGTQVKQPDGTISTFREAVHHQFIASLSNLLTVADGREELLTDYYRVKQENVRSRAGAFVFPPSKNPTRLEKFAGKLRHQQIEVQRATESFRVGRAVSADSSGPRGQNFPVGTLIVRTDQPLKQLIEVLLTFDIRIPSLFLEIEKKQILKHSGSKLYEVTAWSMPLAYGLESYYAESAPGVKTEPWQPMEPIGGLVVEDSPVGFVFDGTDDRSVHLLVRLLERGVRVHCARKPFENAGRPYARGSYQVRLRDNRGLRVEELRTLAEQTGVEVAGIASSLGSPPFADLGGNEFALLEPPRIAIVTGSPVSFYSFGAIWHLLDNRLQLRTTQLDVAAIGGSIPFFSVDLAKYNVIVLPDNFAGAANYKSQLGDAGVKKLKDWVHDGGTLIAEGAGAAFLADTSVAVSSVRLRQQSLTKLPRYEAALAWAKDAESPAIDSLALWDETDGETAEEKDAPKSPQQEKLELEDEIARKLFPRGAILNVDLDSEHWLTSGCGPRVPVLFSTNYTYLAPRGVQVPGRLAPSGQLRLSGLLWPEARMRWAETGYMTHETVGKGQVILFASLPNFRGYFHGAERLLINAMILGPGFGARQSIEW